MKIIILLIALLPYSQILPAQPIELNQDVFTERRINFMQQMDSNAVAIFPSKPIYQRNLDVDYPYRQESNFYYLSGLEEPKSLLFINPSAPKYKYILYVKEITHFSNVWIGPRTGTEGAMQVFKADTALSINDLKSTLRKFIKYDRPIYYESTIEQRSE